MNMKQKLSMSSIVGYGIGGAGQVVAINLFYMYFIFFLTSAAGVSPGIAGTLSMFAVFWDAITDPIIGYLSDKFKGNKYGKRVPFMMFACVPLGLSIIMLFTDIGLQGNAKIVYIFIANILFWTFFTATDIPYISLASEITDDYDERTKLRTATTTFSNLGSIILTSGVMLALEFLLNRNMSDIKAWSLIAIALGIFVIFCYMTSALLLKGKEIVKNETVVSEKQNGGNPIAEYLGLFKLKQYRYIVFTSFTMNFVIGISASSLTFYYLYVVNLDYATIALVPLVPTVLHILAAVPIGNLALKIGKKNCMLLGMILMTASSLYLTFGLMNFTTTVATMAITMIGNTAFWILIYSLNFDIVEIDEFKNGKRRDGQLISLNSFIMKLGVAVGMWAGGMLLEIVNMDATLTSQPQEVVSMLRFVGGGLPAVATLIGIVFIFLYKVNKENFQSLQEALLLKRDGKEYTTDGFEEIL